MDPYTLPSCSVTFFRCLVFPSRVMWLTGPCLPEFLHFSTECLSAWETSQSWATMKPGLLQFPGGRGSQKPCLAFFSISLCWVPQPISFFCVRFVQKAFQSLAGRVASWIQLSPHPNSSQIPLSPSLTTGQLQPLAFHKDLEPANMVSNSSRLHP